jgi:ubiquinone/menaquinone biosynthesis C-methylase UbiE
MKTQAEYYRATAAHYDGMHLAESDEHSLALRYVAAYIREFEMHSVLDVGTGTGRAIGALARADPSLALAGVEPVLAMLERARTKRDLRTIRLVSASGYDLPFEDATFDAVCAFGVLHHVDEPARVVREMLRVARCAVFVSDSNRFGQGRPAARLAKLTLHSLRLWPAANYLKTGGTGYTVSEGDGISYSYSVYDSLRALQDWADRVTLIPTGTMDTSGWWTPLLTSSHVLACAVRDQ